MKVRALLLIALAVLLGALAQRYDKEWDLTRNFRHSLSPSTLQILKNMRGPLTVTAFAAHGGAELGDMRGAIAEFFAPYRRAKPDLSLVFVDPAEEPKRAEAMHVRSNGEMVVEFGGRSEHLLTLNEEAVGNLLLRLSRQKTPLVMALAGHGERRLAGRANFDLGNFGAELKKRGYALGELNLAIAQEVPANASVLIVATPQIDLLPGEMEKISAFLDRGGNLLWLADLDPSARGTLMHGLQPLLEKLSLNLSAGVAVDPAAEKLRAPRTWALASQYGAHAITRNFNLITVFPYAHAVSSNENSPWHFTPLVEAAQNGWLANGDPARGFDKTRDIPGPLSVAAALERGSQRVVVVGTGEFLANSFVGNGGNMDFGLNVVDWLASDDKLISIRPKATVDAEMMLGKNEAIGMALVMLVLLPLSFLVTAGVIAWRRRR